ncbi:hypothetical protein TNIN_283081 [Trichonephila inaurata madagascariensis]|uniref:Uncharacterized protein n=1 Tax=Trichonephila inaurata madagascariensis TaxID=2747483 RepID=A0A8X6YF94_9ARAC|nr:hypothetical protein TNIN_283081 [Trichonephila inaurata madagascariensis]
MSEPSFSSQDDAIRYYKTLALEYKRSKCSEDTPESCESRHASKEPRHQQYLSPVKTKQNNNPHEMSKRMEQKSTSPDDSRQQGRAELADQPRGKVSHCFCASAITAYDCGHVISAHD